MFVNFFMICEIPSKGSYIVDKFLLNKFISYSKNFFFILFMESTDFHLNLL